MMSVEEEEDQAPAGVGSWAVGYGDIGSMRFFTLTWWDIYWFRGELDKMGSSLARPIYIRYELLLWKIGINFLQSIRNLTWQTLQILDRTL